MFLEEFYREKIDILNNPVFCKWDEFCETERLWCSISFYCPLAKILEDNISDLEYYWVCQNENLPLSFFEKNNSVIVWESFVQNNNIPLSFFEKYLLDFSEKEIYNLCRHNTLTNNFVEKYHSLIPENSIGNSCLSIEIARKYSSKINWNMINISILTEEFIEEFIEKFDKRWNQICRSENLSLNFFEKYLDKLNWSSISQNKSISSSFFERYLENVNLEQICNNPSISIHFLEKHLPKIDLNKLTLNKNVTEEFFEKYLDSTFNRWSGICAYYNFSENFFKKYLSKIDWDNLSQNPNISAHFLHKYCPNDKKKYFSYSQIIISLIIKNNIDHPLEDIFSSRFEKQLYFENKIHSFSFFKNDF